VPGRKAKLYRFLIISEATDILQGKLSSLEVKMKQIIVIFLSLYLLFFSSSCAVNPNLGTIREHHDVTTVFRSYQVISDYNYFYYGIYLEPDTIMGIEKKYTVESEFWTPVALTPEQLETWVIALDRVRDYSDFARSYRWRYQGAYVLDPQGSIVGIWYSKLDWGVFDFPGGNVIRPFQPSLKPGSEPLYFHSRDD
jgi:hypothetical protein